MKLKKTFSIKKSPVEQQHQQQQHQQQQPQSHPQHNSQQHHHHGSGNEQETSSTKQHKKSSMLRLGFHKSKVPSLASPLLLMTESPGEASIVSGGVSGSAGASIIGGSADNSSESGMGNVSKGLVVNDSDDDDDDFIYGKHSGNHRINNNPNNNPNPNNNNNTSSNKSKSERKITLPHLTNSLTKKHKHLKSKSERISSISPKKSKSTSFANSENTNTTTNNNALEETPQPSMISNVGTFGSNDDDDDDDDDIEEENDQYIDYTYSYHESVLENMSEVDEKSKQDEPGERSEGANHTNGNDSDSDESADEEDGDGGFLGDIVNNDSESSDSVSDIGESESSDWDPLSPSSSHDHNVRNIGNIIDNDQNNNIHNYVTYSNNNDNGENDSGEDETSKNSDDDDDDDDDEPLWTGKGTASGITIDANDVMLMTPNSTPSGIESAGGSFESFGGGGGVNGDGGIVGSSGIGSSSGNGSMDWAGAVVKAYDGDNDNIIGNINTANGTDGANDDKGEGGNVSQSQSAKGNGEYQSQSRIQTPMTPSTPLHSNVSDSYSNRSQQPTISSSYNEANIAASTAARLHYYSRTPNNDDNGNNDIISQRREFGPIDLDDSPPSSSPLTQRRGFGPVDLDDSLPSSLASTPEGSPHSSFDPQKKEFLQLDTDRGCGVTGRVAGSGGGSFVAYNIRRDDDDCDGYEFGDDQDNDSVIDGENDSDHDEKGRDDEPDAKGNEESAAVTNGSTDIDNRDHEEIVASQDQSTKDDANENSSTMTDEKADDTTDRQEELLAHDPGSSNIEIAIENPENNASSDSDGDSRANEQDDDDDDEMSKHSWDLLQRTDTATDSFSVVPNGGDDDGETESVMAMSTTEEVAGKLLVQSLLGNGPTLNNDRGPYGGRDEEDDDEHNEHGGEEDKSVHSNHSREQLSDDDYYKQDYTMMFRSGSNRTRTNTGSMSDDDYYRQDYPMLFRRKKSQQSQSNDSLSVSQLEGSNGVDNRPKNDSSHYVADIPSSSENSSSLLEMSERAQSTLFPKKEDSLKLTPDEIRCLTEPDLPEGMGTGEGIENDEDGGDYGDFYNDAELPVVDDDDDDKHGRNIPQHLPLENRESSGDLTAYPTNGKNAKLSSGELRELTEPELPKNRKQSEDDGDEGDYSKFYTEEDFIPVGEDDAAIEKTSVPDTPSSTPVFPNDGDESSTADSSEKGENAGTMPLQTLVPKQLPHNEPTETPMSSNKEITDNLMAAGMLSLFVGEGGLGASSTKQKSRVDSENAAVVQTSPGLYSIPSLGSPSPVKPPSLTRMKDGPEMMEPTQLRFEDSIAESPEEREPIDNDDFLSETIDATNTPATTSAALATSPVNPGESQSSERQLFPVSSIDAADLANGPKEPAPVAIFGPETPERSRPMAEIEVHNVNEGNEGNSKKTTLITDDFGELPDDTVGELKILRTTTSDSLMDSPSRSMNESFAMSYDDSKFNIDDPRDIEKLMRDNNRLRAKRKELLASLSSIALKFAASEKKNANRISTLETQIATMRNNFDDSDEMRATKKDESPSPDTLSGDQPGDAQAKKSFINEYDLETVRRLSSGVLKQEQHLEEKEKVISQLKIRCHTLKKNLAEKEEEHDQEKRLWREERLGFERKITDQSNFSPVRQNIMSLKRELLSSRLENNRLKKDLDNALSDVTSLTTALENNNQLSESILREVEELRRWKTSHLEKHPESVQSAEPQPEGKNEDSTVSRTNSLKSSPPEDSSSADLSNTEEPANDKSIAAELETALRDKDTEILMLKKNLDSTTKEVASLQQKLESSLEEVAQLREWKQSAPVSIPDVTSESVNVEHNDTVSKPGSNGLGEDTLVRSVGEAVVEIELKQKQNQINQLQLQLAASADEISALKKKLGPTTFDEVAAEENSDAVTCEHGDTAEVEDEVNAEPLTDTEKKTSESDSESTEAANTASPKDTDEISDDKYEGGDDIVKELKQKIAALELKIAKHEDGNEGDEEGSPAAGVMSPGGSVTSPSRESTASANVEPASPRVDGKRIISPNRFLSFRRGLLNSIASPKPSYTYDPANPPSQQEVEAMLRERDSKAASLEATIQSYTDAMEQMRADIEKIKADKSASEKEYAKSLEAIKEENESYALQVAGFEKAFMALNEERTGVAKADTDSQIADNTDHGEESESEEENEEELTDDASSVVIGESEVDLKAKNENLEKQVSELESNRTVQEDKIESLKTELAKLRVSMEQEKNSAIEELKSENDIIKAQREALESQLIEINRSASMLRQNLSPSPRKTPPTPGNANDDDQEEASVKEDDGAVGSDPVLVAQVCMLENANMCLEKTVNQLRSEMQEKLTPLLEKIAILEEEKRMSEEEMQTKLQCREMTIANLELSLKQAKASRLNAPKKKKTKKPKQTSSDPVNDQAALSQTPGAME